MKEEKKNFVIPGSYKFANNYIDFDGDSSPARMIVELMCDNDFYHIENCAIISLRYFKRLLIKNEEYEKVKYVNELIKNAREKP